MGNMFMNQKNERASQGERRACVHPSVIELHTQSCWYLPYQLLLSWGCSVSFDEMCSRVWRTEEQIQHCGIWSCTFPLATFNKEKCSEEITLLVSKQAGFCSTFPKTDKVVVIVYFPFHGPRLQNKTGIKNKSNNTKVLLKQPLTNVCRHLEKMYDAYIPSSN